MILTLIISMHAYSQEWKTKIIEDAKSIYTPVAIQAFRKPIYFREEENDSVGAAADHAHDSLSIIVYSGLLKSPRLTPDGLRMILCHELGHLFGGAPRRHIPMEWEGPIADDGMSFMSSEGQADYYAGLTCFRKLIEIAEAGEPSPDMSRVGPRLRRKCSENETCMRAGLAGEDFLKVVFEFPISCEKFDDSISPVLVRDSYPGRQCRLDTIMSANICTEAMPMVLDFNQSELNTCSDSPRPACWYKD